MCTLRSASRVKRPLTKLPHTRDTRAHYVFLASREYRRAATEASKVVLFVLRTGTCELAQRLREKDTGFCGVGFGSLMTLHNEDDLLSDVLTRTRRLIVIYQ